MADGLSSGMRWSTVSVIGREASRAIFTVVIARLVGPGDFGIVAQAMVYIGIVGLLVDQGFSSALIQRKHIEPGMPGAVVSVNLTVGALLTALTIAIAPVWASFMHTPQLMMVLVALSPSLVLRAATVTSRAMLMRSMDFRKIAIADTSAAISGGVLGLVVAIAGGRYWAVVVQILGTDAVYFLVLLAVGAGWRPNLRLRLLREIAGFSGRAFTAGVLIGSVSRNIDNLLVGRFQGPQALAFYGLAYRLLLLPVQLAGTTVSAVLFPAFAKLAHDLASMAAEVARATRALALLALPPMALVAAAAPQLVDVIFGSRWEPAIPIAQVLAITGAIQTIYLPTTTPIVLGLGRAKLNLRYAWLTTVTVTMGVVAGLPFGPFGVALGYSAATALLVPVEWFIRRHLLGMAIRRQIATLIPAAHIAIWVAGAYLLVATLIPIDGLALAVGIVVAVSTGAAVLHIAHRSLSAELVHMVNRMVGGRGGSPSESAGEPPPGSAPELGSVGPADENDVKSNGEVPKNRA
jgi:O-antigen/teichoic acid export membrane protein